jgi:hypothetical protein
MTVTKTDITANKPATNQLTQVSAGDTVTAEIENANNLLLLQAVILAYNWIIDSGVELNGTNIFTAAQQFAAGLKTYQIDPLNPNGDILINSGTGNVYQNSISALTKYLTYQEITALIAAVSGVTDGDKGDITISGGANIFTIDNSAVTTAKIADSNVTEIKLATDSVTTNKIANLNVTEGKLASDSVTTNKIANLNVTEGKLADNAVTTNKIANGTITANKLGFTVAGTLVKNTEASLGSDSVVTATTATASGLAIAYTPITGTNDRYIYGEIDWNVNDPDGSAAEGFIDLQYSTDNSTWSTLDTFTRSANLGAGAKEVKVTSTSSTSDATTSSSTYQTCGLSVSYTPINGANVRYIEFCVEHRCFDSDPGAFTTIQLQYSTDNTTWSSLRTYNHGAGFGGATSADNYVVMTDFVRHSATTNTPYYRIMHNSPSSNGSSTVFSGSTLRVREVEEQFVINNRSPVTFLFKHNANTTTPYYRVAHRVTSGDQSTIYTGSVLRVMEFSL